jgi:hypothetical protein
LYCYKKIKKECLWFEANEQFSNKTLIIDPVPVRLWGTYFGKAGNLIKKNKNR